MNPIIFINTGTKLFLLFATRVKLKTIIKANIFVLKDQELIAKWGQKYCCKIQKKRCVFRVYKGEKFSIFQVCYLYGKIALHFESSVKSLIFFILIFENKSCPVK